MARSVLLTDYVQSHGARCLDGSPQRIWLQLAAPGSANASKWYFHFMGGGWCESTASCTSRAYDPAQCYRGSSSEACFDASGCREPGKTFEEEMDFRDVPCINGARWGGGLLMGDARTNPLTHDWNKVEMHYCSGGSYAGNNDTVSYVQVEGKSALMPLYYRGQRNLAATMDYLKQNHGLQDASHFVVSGDSAGGLATYWHADYFSAELPDTKVLAAPDSGFFYGDSHYPKWPASLEWIATQMNSTLDASCVAAARAAGESVARSCTLPEDVSRHVTTPLFVVNSMFDPALHSISSGGKLSFSALGEGLVSRVNRTVLQRPSNAAFLTACSEHCGQWAQGQVLAGNDDFNVTIDGWNAATAVDSWARALWSQPPRAPQRRVWKQDASYPCKTCCSGGNE